MTPDELQTCVEERARRIRSVQDKSLPPVEFDRVHQRVLSEVEPTMTKIKEDATFQREGAQKTVTTPVKLFESPAPPVEPIPAPKTDEKIQPPPSSTTKKKTTTSSQIDTQQTSA